MRMTPLIIGLLVFSGLAVGFTTFFDGVMAKHGTGISSEDMLVLNRLDISGDINRNITQPLKGRLEAAKANPLTGTLSFFIDSTIQGAKLMISLPAIISNMVTSLIFLLDVVTLPSWVFSMITGIVSVIIVLMIVAAIMRWKL